MENSTLTQKKKKNPYERGDGSIDHDSIYADYKKSLDNTTFIAEDAVKHNPDDHAKSLDLSKKTGLPTEVVESQREAIDQKVRADDVSARIKDSSVLESWINENPQFARIAHDDMEALGLMGAAGNALKRGGLRVEMGANQWAAEGYAEQAFDSDRSFGAILKDQMGEHSIIPDPIDLIAATERFATSRLQKKERAEAGAQKAMENVGRIGKQISETAFSAPATRAKDSIMEAGQYGILQALDAAVQDPLGTMALAAEVGLEFAPQLAAGTAATVATSPVGGAIVMGTLSGMTERYASPSEFLSNRGVDLTNADEVARVLTDPDLMRAAADYGYTRGMIIGAFDMASGGLASKQFGGIIRNFVTQSVLQSAMGGGGEAFAQLKTTGEIDAGEIVLEAIGEFAFAPIEAVGVGGQYVSDATRARRAKADKTALEEIEKIESKLKGRGEQGNEALASLKAQIYRDKGIESFSISGEGLTEYNQSGGDMSWIESLGLSKDDQIELYEAMEGDIELTPEQYARIPEEVKDKLKDHVRIDDGMTPAEAEEFEASGLEDEINQIGESLEEMNLEQQTDYNLILQKVEDQLVNQVGMDASVARSDATLIAERYTARAAHSKSGMTALDLFERDNLVFTNEDLAGDNVFRQDDPVMSIDNENLKNVQVEVVDIDGNTTTLSADVVANDVRQRAKQLDALVRCMNGG